MGKKPVNMFIRERPRGAREKNYGKEARGKYFSDQSQKRSPKHRRPIKPAIKSLKSFSDQSQKRSPKQRRPITPAIKSLKSFF